jgi:hypothetical protein
MIKRMFRLLMALLVLISTSGATINKMECLKSGKVKASLFDIKNCCAQDNSASNTIQSKCCNYSVYYLKVELSTTIEKNKLAEKIIQPILVHFITFFLNLSSKLEISTYTYSSSLPPLLFGKNLLQAIQVFRI